MADHDVEKERRRLAELYAGMAEGELEKLAAEAGSLSDAAREVLERELARRKLAVALQERSAAPKAEPPGPVTLRRQFAN